MENIERNKQRLDKIPTLLKRFRQSVLSSALCGKLTSDWRKANSKVTTYTSSYENNQYEWKVLEFPKNWTWDYQNNLGHHVLGKMLDSVKNIGEPTKYLRNISVRWFEFDLDNLTEIRATIDDKRKFDIRNGDLFICEGGEPGRCAIWENGKNSLIFQKAIHRIRLIPSINPYWLAFNIKHDADNGNLEQLFTGTGIKHLTRKSLSNYPVVIPPIEEQKEIVRRVEELFAFADKIEARYNNAKAMLDKLPQSILAKAFRGELVQQNENDEPASVLLDRIKAEKAKLAVHKKIKISKSSSQKESFYNKVAEKRVKYKSGN